MIERGAAKQEWAEHHNRVLEEASKRNYGLLRFLAEDFGRRSIVEGRDASKNSGEGTGPIVLPNKPMKLYEAAAPKATGSLSASR